MTHRHVWGREGMLLTIIAAAAMLAVAFFAGAPLPATGDHGLCLPSPSEWAIPPFWSQLTNVLTISLTVFGLYFANKNFTIVQGSDTVVYAMFLIMLASNPWIDARLNSSAIMAAGNLLCLTVLMGCYRKSNASQELFFIATVLSLGSMIQYSFAFMLPVYLIGAIMMKCFSFRVLAAYAMGIIAPYWVGIGMGIIPPDAISIPTFTTYFDSYSDKEGLFFGLLNIAVTVLIGFILALNNVVKLYAGNTQRRLYNTVIYLLGFVTVVCMLVDFNNLTTYIGTIYMITAIQLGNLFALWNVHRGWLWLLILSLLYVADFILMII